MSQTPLYRIGERLAGVQVYRADAMSVIAGFAGDPDCLIYADPPYVHSTRRGAGDYEHEMVDSDHERMLAMMRDADAHILISGYACELYDTALRGWDRREFEVNSSAAVGKNGVGIESGRSRRTEVLWANYDLSLADWKPQQGQLI